MLPYILPAHHIFLAFHCILSGWDALGSAHCPSVRVI